MQEKANVIYKMLDVYAAQSADAKRTLNSLLFEYEPVLMQFSALRQEMQRIMDSADDLDVAVIVERLRPALQTASTLAVEIDMLDEAVRNHPEMNKFISQVQANLRLSSAGVFADKFQARVEAAQEKKNVHGTEFKDCDDGPAMVVVPAGNFMMGSPQTEAGRYADESPRYRVKISRAFAVGKYPVTVTEWAVFLQATGYAWNEKRSFSQSHDHPVVKISWRDAKAYVEWLVYKTGKGYRLLSEAEWEYAARAGTQTPYPFPKADTSKYANGFYNKKDFEYTSPVGSFPANAFGLYDMIGNVWEWVEDCYFPFYSGAPGNGTARIDGAAEARVLRGGAWDSDPQELRAAYRNNCTPARRFDDIGFRVARTVP